MLTLEKFEAAGNNSFFPNSLKFLGLLGGSKGSQQQFLSVSPLCQMLTRSDLKAWGFALAHGVLTLLRCVGSWCASSIAVGLQLDKTSLWLVYVTEELTSWWLGKGGWAGHTLSVLCPLICLKLPHFPVMPPKYEPISGSAPTQSHLLLMTRSTRQGPSLST